MAENNYEIEGSISVSKEKDKIIFEQFKKMKEAQKLLVLVVMLMLVDMASTILNYNAMIHIISSTLCIVAIIYVFFKRRKERKVIKKILLPIIREQSNTSATLKEIRVLNEDEDKKHYGLLLIGTILIAVTLPIVF